MPNKIVLKKSSVTSKIPLTSDLDFGELALNYADGKLYYKKSDGTTIDSFTAGVAGNVTTTGTQTLTNKRIDPRVSSAASASSITPDVSLFDMYAFTALAADLSINAPIGTPVNGSKLMFRILDNGTSRVITWNATYASIGVTLPTSTTASKTLYVGCIYNAANTRWDVVAVTTEA